MIQYIGAHILGNKNIPERIKECVTIGGNAIQIFTKSPINTTDKTKITNLQIKQIRAFIKRTKFLLVTHGSYMLNMSWPIHRNPWGIKMLMDDLKITSKMEGLGVVIHMGRATPKLKITMQQAKNNFVKSISMILDKVPKKVKLILETSCNQKNGIAGTIEELSIIWNMFAEKHKKQLGFCIDTAHIFTAGYPIDNKHKFTQYLQKFDKIIGLDHVLLIHVNDSAAKFNSHLDRHTGIGKGYIYKNNTDSFLEMINQCFDHNIPIILETHDNYKKEIAFIKKIYNECQMGGTKVNIKNKVVKILLNMAEAEKNRGNLYKHIAYMRAVKNLKLFRGDITKGNLQQIEGIGKKISAKITEIIKTGKLKQFNIIMEDPDLIAINKLSKIMGIGHVLAKKLVKDYKIKNILGLKKAYENNKINLTNEQILGIKYYKHLQYKIPRREVSKFKTHIDLILKNKFNGLKGTIAGSYRRDISMVGDIDLIIYGKQLYKIPNNLLEKIINQLNKINIAAISLGTTKYSGLVSLQNRGSKVRRIDIRLVPFDSFPTTLLYFTGSKEFNQKMRSIAKKKGYLLNEYGLYKMYKNKKIKIKVNNEYDIFNELNMKFVKPSYRK